MKSIAAYFVDLEIALIALLVLTFVMKTFFYFRVEKYWDSLRFFYYSKVDIKMTTMKRLRVWRKRQNHLSVALGIILVLFTFLYSFHRMVSID